MMSLSQENELRVFVLLSLAKQRSRENRMSSINTSG